MKQVGTLGTPTAGEHAMIAVLSDQVLHLGHRVVSNWRLAMGKPADLWFSENMEISSCQVTFVWQITFEPRSPCPRWPQKLEAAMLAESGVAPRAGDAREARVRPK